MSAHDFEFTSIDGKPLKLSQLAGNAVLVVNTASQCGFTPQYRGLEALWEKYRDRSLVVLGVPSNDFGGQEPGTEAQIKDFCATKFNVTFPMTSKNPVIGASAHPFYKWVVSQAGEGAAPRWNFHKYLIGRDGYIADVFPESVEPSDTRVKTAIARALADT